MLKLLADENLNGDILRGLLLQEPELDVVRVQDVGLLGSDDPEVLTWAAEHDRIVLTHDRATYPTGQAIREILLIVACTQQTEWVARVAYLPL